MPTETIIEVSPGILEQLEDYVDNPWVVILYNCDCHSMDEVVYQVQRATGCTLEQAIWVMQEAHVLGRAIAFSGDLEECERVARVLGSIRLQVETDKA
jgi:ATP-dependent Clp protease adaptor protein ClpS